MKINLSDFVNAADISGSDTPAVVVEKLQRAIDAAPPAAGVMPVPPDLWNEVLEFIEGQVDVRDGADGPRPNSAMALSQRIEEAGLLPKSQVAT